MSPMPRMGKAAKPLKRFSPQHFLSPHTIEEMVKKGKIARGMLEWQMVKSIRNAGALSMGWFIAMSNLLRYYLIDFTVAGRKYPVTPQMVSSLFSFVKKRFPLNWYMQFGSRLREFADANRVELPKEVNDKISELEKEAESWQLAEITRGKKMRPSQARRALRRRIVGKSRRK